MSYYERAYLELNRIIIQHDIINTMNIVKKMKIDGLHQQVNADIDQYPHRIEQIYNADLKELLVMVKAGIDMYKPQEAEKYVYKRFVDFLEEKFADMDLPNKSAVLIAKAIIRLDKFHNKNRSYLYN